MEQFINEQKNKNIKMVNNRSIDIILNGFKSRENLLYLFSSYIASDLNFKYNQTYK